MGIELPALADGPALAENRKDSNCDSAVVRRRREGFI
jgi:hypothetical protein